jgi:ABC-2 type transport system ATP-binding protein
MQKPLEVKNISKSFASTQAVDDLSFEIFSGEIFGLLGPNGAGKTTSIRIILGLLGADQGEVTILGGPMSEAKKDHIGYMPEERGLYQDISLENCLTYLGSLKGLSNAETRKRLDPLLERFDLTEHRRKKVKELSKGMQQKAQIICTILHQPEFIIVDEPFAGLDPVNTNMVKDLLRELSAQGVTILMSTHQMYLVEELCSRILLINHGRGILYGELEEIQQQFSGHAVIVRSPDEIPRLPGIQMIERQNRSDRLILEPDMMPQQLLLSLIETGVRIEGFEIALPSLDEIFIQAVRGDD